MLLAVSPVQAAATETEAPDVSGQKTVYYQPKSVDLTPRKATKEEVKNGEAPAGAYIQSDSVFETASLRHVTDMAKYRLAKYDVINVNVLGFPNGLGYTQSSSTINTGAGTQTLGTGDIIIGPDGNASLPYVGNIRLAGLTLAEADAQLTQALSYYLRDPQLNVAVRSYAPRKILVTGEVMTPGIQHLAIDQLDAYAAITSAGGYTKRGRSTRVQVIRVIDGTMYYRQLNMKDFVRKHDLTQNVVLQDGDIVYVPKSNAIRWNEDILPYFNAWALYKGLTD